MRHLRFWETDEVKDLRTIVKILRDFLAEFKKLESKDPSELFYVTKFFLEENIDLYESAIILRNNGRFLPCLLLARTLLENSVNLRYIYKEDTERRVRNYHIFPIIEYLKCSEDVDLKEVPPGGAEMLEYMREEVKKYNPSGSKANHWDGKSIWKIFEEINLKQSYISLYTRLSGFGHSEFGNRNFQQDRPYINFLKDLLIKNIFVNILDSIRVITERFDMEPIVVKVDDIPKGGILFFSTHPKKSKEEMRSEENVKKS